MSNTDRDFMVGLAAGTLIGASIVADYYWDDGPDEETVYRDEHCEIIRVEE